MTNHLAAENARLREALKDLARELAAYVQKRTDDSQLADDVRTCGNVWIAAYEALALTEAALTPQDHAAGKDVGAETLAAAIREHSRFPSGQPRMSQDMALQIAQAALSQGSGSTDGAWAVRRAALLESEFPEEDQWEVLLPNGEWRGVVAVDEDDARLTIRDEWQAETEPRSRQPAPPASEVGALCERLRAYQGGIFHARGMSIKPRAPSEAETVQITAREAEMIEQGIAEAATLLESLSRNEEVERLREALAMVERQGEVLNSFILLIASTEREDGSIGPPLRWLRPPTQEESQAAMAVNNDAAALLTAALDPEQRS